jgi:hypothetical protein
MHTVCICRQLGQHHSVTVKTPAAVTIYTNICTKHKLIKTIHNLVSFYMFRRLNLYRNGYLGARGDAVD